MLCAICVAIGRIYALTGNAAYKWIQNKVHVYLHLTVTQALLLQRDRLTRYVSKFVLCFTKYGS